MIRLERFSISLIYLREDAPEMSAAELEALQDRHMAHNADMHAAGHLLVAGPVLSPQLRGLSIYATDLDETRALAEANPSVQAGRHRVEVYPWLVPSGLIRYDPRPTPRSAAEVEEP